MQKKNVVLKKNAMYTEQLFNHSLLEFILIY